MKTLLDKFVTALDKYAVDSNSLLRSATQGKSMKELKLDLGLRLQQDLKAVLESEIIDPVDSYRKLINTIEEMQVAVNTKRDARKIAPGYFDNLLEWVSDRLTAAKTQLELHQDEKALSEPHRLVKDKLDEFTVLLDGFAGFPDDRMRLEKAWFPHPKFAVYSEDGWKLDSNLFDEEGIKLISEEVEVIRQTALGLRQDFLFHKILDKLNESEKKYPVLGVFREFLLDAIEEKIQLAEEADKAAAADAELKTDQEVAPAASNEEQERVAKATIALNQKLKEMQNSTEERAMFEIEQVSDNEQKVEQELKEGQDAVREDLKTDEDPATLMGQGKCSPVTFALQQVMQANGKQPAKTYAQAVQSENTIAPSSIARQRKGVQMGK